MKICFIDVLGLCYDGSTLSKRGLGGSESAVIYMADELSKIGFDVTVFNDCESDDCFPGYYNNVLYLPLSEAETHTGYDVVIVQRSVAAFVDHKLAVNFKSFTNIPNFSYLMNGSKHKVLWMHDTFCDGDQYIEDLILAGKINEIFTLSDWHTSYVTNCDHGKRRNFDLLKRHIFQTRNGIKLWKPYVDINSKDYNLFVFNSSVTKGLVPLVSKIWPKLKTMNPNIKLKVIGGYYKFRENSLPDQQEQDWRLLYDTYNGTYDIDFTGIITQKEISDIYEQASFMIYPTTFPETFGISTLEALAHNIPIITCNFGAMEETAFDLASYKIQFPIEKNWAIPYLDEDSQINKFVNLANFAYNNKLLYLQKANMCKAVRDICTWDTVALQWKQHFYKLSGRFLPVDEYRQVQKINNKVSEIFSRRILNREEKPYYKKFSLEKTLQIITPVYNAENYIELCIRSVAQQDYGNYEMYIIDDCSTDNTFNIANEVISSFSEELQRKFILKRNEIHTGSAIYNQITNIKPTSDCVLLLDGDDFLVNDPDIFNRYNDLYHEGIEVSYGSAWSLADNIPLIAQEYPPDILYSKKFRQYKFAWNIPYSHLRTFSYDLFSRIDINLLKINDEWPLAGGDVSLFYALLEAANPDKIKAVTDIVYNYNDLNPINDYKVNSNIQTETANYFTSMIND